jgi:hypothetical protein
MNSDLQRGVSTFGCKNHGARANTQRILAQVNAALQAEEAARLKASQAQMDVAQAREAAEQAHKAEQEACKAAEQARKVAKQARKAAKRKAEQARKVEQEACKAEQEARKIERARKVAEQAHKPEQKAPATPATQVRPNIIPDEGLPESDPRLRDSSMITLLFQARVAALTSSKPKTCSSRLTNWHMRQRNFLTMDNATFAECLEKRRALHRAARQRRAAKQKARAANAAPAKVARNEANSP